MPPVRDEARMATRSRTGPRGSLLLLAHGPPTPEPSPPPAAAESLAFRATVFATADQVPAPVAMSVDDRGVVYVADSFRSAGHGHFDVRAWRGILPDDWRLTSVDEALAATESWAGSALSEW